LEALDILLEVLLHLFNILLECMKSIGLVFEEISVGIVGEVINEGDVVLGTTMRAREWSTKIRMYKFKRYIGFVRWVLLEALSSHFVTKAGVADNGGVWTGDRDTRGNFGQPPNILKV
jgi:hypothetical protein